MMKKRKRTSLITVVLLICLILSAFPPQTLAAGEKVSLSDWMSKMPDTAVLSQLNIPGTHDSGTEWLPEMITAYMGMTQNKSITEQLESGIRLFDIRLDFPTESVFYSTDYTDLCVVHGVLACYLDGPLDTRLRFTHITKMCEDFLNAHPTETVILKLQAESTLFDNTSVEEAIESFRRVCSDRYIYCNRADSVQKVPTMGEARGKIIIMTEVGGQTSTKYEDHYDVSADEKIKDLKKCFDESAPQAYVFDEALWPVFCGDGRRNEEGREGEPAVKLVFTSSNLVYLGPLVISSSVNSWVEKYNFKRGTRYGWVLMDFPTEKMVRKIIDSNAGTAELILKVDWSQTIPGIGRFELRDITLFRENSTHVRTPVSSRSVIMPESGITDGDFDTYCFSGLAISDENGEDWSYTCDIDFFSPMYWTYNCTNEEADPPQGKQRTTRRITADIVMDPPGVYGTINASMYDNDTGEFLGNPEVYWNENTVIYIDADYLEKPSEQLNVRPFIDSDKYEIVHISANNVTTGSGLFPTFYLNKNGVTDMTILVRKAVRYDVTVQGGQTNMSVAKAGDTVYIQADSAPEGMEFARWEVISGDITLSDPYDGNASFTMPGSAVEVKAVFAKLIPDVEITEITVTLKEPAPGETPDTAPEVVSSPESGARPELVVWYRLPSAEDPYAVDAAWEEMTNGEVCEIGYYYAVGLSYLANDGWAFSKTLSGTINGRENCAVGAELESSRYRAAMTTVFDSLTEENAVKMTDGIPNPAQKTPDKRAFDGPEAVGSVITEGNAAVIVGVAAAAATAIVISVFAVRKKKK